MEAAGRSFDEFYLDHFDHVARALVLAGADRDMARDSAQEAFARALRKWQEVREMGRPDGWVYVVAMNHLRDCWRRAGRVDPPEEAVAPDASGSVVTRLSVRDAIQTLSPRQRQAVVLRYLVDLPLADVAEAMGCAVGTVKATIHHALGAMRIELDDTEAADAH
jgi:RNA polymerase sigma-70 factor (ECF subfamily)